MKLHPGIKWGCLVPLIIVMALVAAIFAIDALLPSSARRALPKSASNVQEYYSGSWNGDFIRLIRADLPKEDYETYAAALGLSQRYDATKHSDIKRQIEVGIGDAPDWWTPPRASDTTFFQYTKDDEYYIRSLRYSNGAVYYLVTSW